jgi:hypothetical protein
MWWIANTSAHNFIHRPFFTRPALNAAYSVLLTAILGVPQTLWRDRHLAHHARRQWRFHLSRSLVGELAFLAAGWVACALVDPMFLLTVYLPGWAAGLGLCAIQGHFEHLSGTTSHYGRLYNGLCFNDGYHAEHHARPGLHWTRLPDRPLAGARSSRWPALLRWLDLTALDSLERLVLRSPRLQRIVLRHHRRAFERLLPHLPPVNRIVIVGGGLFPRTALILQELFPAAQIAIVDANPRHLARARDWLGRHIVCECRRYPDSHDLNGEAACDLLVIPLAFDGDRAALYEHPTAPAVIVHDWIWRRRGQSRIVSIALMKRLNLMTRHV